ncbi:MAG: hypothetical protein SFV81_12535 [Pirellulaceae bacterium]|nr:hypothetical protein [Pirellulaceae bacterium]
MLRSSSLLPVILLAVFGSAANAQLRIQMVTKLAPPSEDQKHHRDL